MNYLSLSSFTKLNFLNAFNSSHLNFLNNKVKLEIPRIDKSVAIKVIGVSIAGLSVIYVGKLIYSYNFFKSLGVKTPKYKFFFGHLLEINEKNYSDCLQEWTNELGLKTYGIYEGHFPVLVTSDLSIIQDVFINQVGNFTARKQVPFISNDKEAPLFMSTRNRWKRLRSVINPTFSPAKLKQLTGLIRKCSDRLVVLLNKQIDKEINLQEYFNNLAMDVVWNCGYGLDIDCQNNPNDPFVVNIKRFFARLDIFIIIVFFYEFKSIYLATLSFLTFFLSKFNSNFDLSPFHWIRQNLDKIVEKRILNNVKRKDYVQLLLETQTHDLDREKDQQNYDPSNVDIEKKMTLKEIINQLGMFLFAGMETVSNTLNYCIYALLVNPDEIKKLQDEIDEGFDLNLQNDDEIYENINKLEYLDMFIKEVMRMYPIATSVINRRCTNPTEIKIDNNFILKVPENFVIAIDVLSLHFNQEHWGNVDTNEFYPLRFSSDYKRNKLAYMPFGIGPRNCIGMRFALLEVKLTLIKLLKNFDIHSLNKTEKLRIQERGVRRPANGINCVFKKRA